MPVIKSKMIRVRDPETGFWHDLPATVSEESFRAAERALQSETSAASSAASAASSADAASSSASDAATSAGAAASSASDAALAKEETVGYAETAGTKASDAQSYAGQAQDAASDAESYKDTAVAKAAAAALSEENAAASASAASSSESAAAGYATSAESDASDAEAYGAGTRGGNPVGSTDPAYHNNAAYYADQASSAEASATSAASSASAAGTSAAAAADSATAAAASAQAAESSVLGSNFAPYITNTLTAPANITAGEYVVAAGTLYRATANIASGSTLTPNGNVTQVTVGEELTEVIASNAQKADANGTSPHLTAGNALQLVSTVGVEDQVPYNFRASGGGADIGDRETDMIVGGTLAWNQIMPDATATYTSNGVTLTSSGALITLSGNSDAASGYINFSIANKKVKLIDKHKYFINIVPVTDIGTTDIHELALIYGNGGSIECNRRTGKIVMQNGDTTGNSTLFVRPSYTFNGTFSFYCCLHDLTQMFGTTIADYIYSLEQANAGDGVAWFKKLFPNDYYAYDAGTLRSVQTSAHKMVGFNAFDKSASDVTIGKYLDANGEPVSNAVSNVTGYIPVIRGQTYYFADAASSAVDRYMFWYDSGKNIINGSLIPFTGDSSANHKKTAPENAAYVRVSVAVSRWDTFVVNLSWDGERDGEFEAYAEHSYTLDDSLTLRGLPMLDENNKLRYDGDTYASDGTVTRRYGTVDLGTLTWQKVSSENHFYASNAPLYRYENNTRMLCTEYVFDGIGRYPNYYPTGDKMFRCLVQNNPKHNELYVTDSTRYASMDAAQFKAAMSGVILIYELETTTTESADPYTNPQIVDDFGTEEYVDAGVESGARDVAIPVGHETFYQANLRAKLEAAPDSPDGDGDYLLRQTNGENVYVPFVTDTTMNVSGKAADAAAVGVGMRNLLGVLQELAGVLGDTTLPAMPDGTYILKATVTNGEVSYSWIAET